MTESIYHLIGQLALTSIKIYLPKSPERLHGESIISSLIVIELSTSQYLALLQASFKFPKAPFRLPILRERSHGVHRQLRLRCGSSNMLQRRHHLYG